MADLSSYSFTGRLTKDAQVKNINNKTLVEMDVANNIGYGDYKKTNWLKVKWWGDRAANSAPIFTRGAQVTATGELTTDTYTGRDGLEHTNIVITVFGVQLLSKPKADKSESSEDSDFPEDIPF